MLKIFYIKETREQILNRFKDNLPSDFSKDNWINAEITDISIISEDYVFDLGGRELKIIKCPGHTPGSICLLDKQDKILFSGDSILKKPVLMNLETSLPLNIYLKSIKHINSYSDSFNTILSGHDEKPVNTVVIEELINGVSEIIEGKIKGNQKKTRFGEALVSKFDHSSIN